MLLSPRMFILLFILSVIFSVLHHLPIALASTPLAGGPGRAMYFSTRGGHTADIMTWHWKVPPVADFTIEYWWREVDHHILRHPVLNYAAFDETRSPMYEHGSELTIAHDYDSVLVSK